MLSPPVPAPGWSPAARRRCRRRPRPSSPTTATVRPPAGTTRPVLSTERTRARSPSTTGPPAPPAPLTGAARAQQVAQRGEVAHVVPAEPAGHDRHLAAGGRRLGDGVVDARSWAACRPHVLQGGGVGGDAAQGGGELGVGVGQEVEQHRRPHHEHPGVPPVAGLDVRRRPPPRTASPRTRPPARAASPGERLAGTYVAEARSPGCGRLDPDRHQPALAGRRDGAALTAARNASWSVITWSAAKEPITASGSRRSSRAAARPIAAIESRADGSATTSSAPRAGSWATHGVAVRGAGDHQGAARRSAGPAGPGSPAAASARPR